MKLPDENLSGFHQSVSYQKVLQKAAHGTRFEPKKMGRDTVVCENGEVLRSYHLFRSVSVFFHDVGTVS